MKGMKGQIANTLTVLRIVAAFFYLVWALRDDWPVALVIFTAAAVTDLVDGAIARLFHQKTRLGAFLDPAADKLLMFFGFLSLTIAGAVPVGLFTLVTARDLLITFGICFFAIRRTRLVYRPTLLSKATTLAQILYLSTVLVKTADGFRTLPRYDTLLTRAEPVLVLAVAGLTAVTMIQYFVIGLRILKGETRSGAEDQAGRE